MQLHCLLGDLKPGSCRQEQGWQGESGRPKPSSPATASKAPNQCFMSLPQHTSKPRQGHGFL